MRPEEINVVIYHAGCTDGTGAAWAAWKLLGDNAQYIPAGHSSKPPNLAGKRVALCDFAYDRATMLNIMKQAEAVVVLDHHISKIEELKGIEGIEIDVTQSGAMIAWKYFHPGVPPPRFIEYIQDKDLWKFELPFSKEFSVIMDAIPQKIEVYDRISSDAAVSEQISVGKHVVKYRDLLVKRIAKRAISKRLSGQLAPAAIVNTDTFISEVCHELLEQHPECLFSMAWSYDHVADKVRCSLRSRPGGPNVSKIAQVYDLYGGGHENSAGFSVKMSKFQNILKG